MNINLVLTIIFGFLYFIISSWPLWLVLGVFFWVLWKVSKEYSVKIVKYGMFLFGKKRTGIVVDYEDDIREFDGDVPMYFLVVKPNDKKTEKLIKLETLEFDTSLFPIGSTVGFKEWMGCYELIKFELRID